MIDEPLDGYDGYYRTILWNLLPEIYRISDNEEDRLEVNEEDRLEAGPLKQLLAILAGQVAESRRAIDRLWANQGIDSCDDWVIPHIGALVATRLVDGLDGRGRRLDVANTVRWRRSSGTLATMESVARDITGWSAHVVEGSRRLARYPARSQPASLNIAARANQQRCLDVAAGEATPVGGLLDLRSTLLASMTGGPFDQAFAMPDLRKLGDSLGPGTLDRLTVHIWRLDAHEVRGATPVKVHGSVDEYVFDPTGREVRLFLPGALDTESIDQTSRPWQVPAPLSTAMARWLSSQPGLAPPFRTPGNALVVTPERGRFRVGPTHGKPDNSDSGGLSVDYSWGSPGGLGAGAVHGGAPPFPTREGATRVADDAELNAALADVRTASQPAAIIITNSRTYQNPAPAVLQAPSSGASSELRVSAGPTVRPLLRLHSGTEQPQEWVFTGSRGSVLVLDGLFVSGGDVVLRGVFDSVVIRRCTLDPGTLETPGRLRQSVDDRPLRPTRLWVERGAVAQILVEGSVLGPIRTRTGGVVHRLVVRDSVVQGFRTSEPTRLHPGDFYDPMGLAHDLSGFVKGATEDVTVEEPWLLDLSKHLDRVVERRSYEQAPMEVGDGSTSEMAAVINEALSERKGRRARHLEEPDGDAAEKTRKRDLSRLEQVYPYALRPAACALRDASVTLERVTLLGPVLAHRMQATDSILLGRTTVEDCEDGWIRCSAVEQDSVLPFQDHRCLQLRHGSSPFTSTRFGDAAYAQLADHADQAVNTEQQTVQISIATGASSGSEMGAYSNQRNSTRHRALRAKLTEFAPFSLRVHIAYVT